MKHLSLIFLCLFAVHILPAQSDTLRPWQPVSKYMPMEEWGPMTGFESIFHEVLMTDTIRVWQSERGTVLEGENLSYMFRMLMNKPGEPLHVFYECQLHRPKSGLILLEAKWRMTETVRKTPRGGGNPLVAETVTEGVDFWLLGHYMKVGSDIRLLSLPVSAKTTRWEEMENGERNEQEPAYCAIKSKLEPEEGKLYVLGTTCLGPQVNIFASVLEGVYRVTNEGLVRE